MRTITDTEWEAQRLVAWDEHKEVPVGEIPFAPTTSHTLPCGHVLITYRANDSLTLRNHKQTCRGGQR